MDFKKFIRPSAISTIFKDYGSSDKEGAKGVLENYYRNLREAVPNVSGAPNYYSLLANYYRKLNEQARKEQLASIEARLGLNQSLYEQEFANIERAYDKVAGKNELAREYSKGSIREALANRGQLDTGLGRMETLTNELNYGNRANEIAMEREGQKQNIRNMIAQLKADAQDEKANVNLTYKQALENWVRSKR